MGRPTEEVNDLTRVLLAMVLVWLSGCASVKESGEESTSSTRLREFEASFRPSDHDQPLKEFFPGASAGEQRDSSSSSMADTPPPEELTQGYRVQVYATSSYDDATKMRLAAEGQFPEEWFYVVYDAPTYKLRGGNFQERYEADRFAKLLGEKGYRNAWVVPEKVLKNPPYRTVPHQDTRK